MATVPAGGGYAVLYTVLTLFTALAFVSRGRIIAKDKLPPQLQWLVAVKDAKAGDGADGCDDIFSAYLTFSKCIQEILRNESCT